MVVAARLGNATVIVSLARENFRKPLVDAALFALKHSLAQAFAGDLAVEVHLKLCEALGKLAALFFLAPITVEDHAHARFERLGGLANDILVALAQKNP